ncbi:MAG: hypothetical protein M1820_007647 [Bogoriella megaspora]|nr:MAG: hypothetical protein M1820_007647 [Bogoriella megaspora]
MSVHESSKIPTRPAANASVSPEKPLSRADEVSDLLRDIQDLIIPFIRAADEDAASKPTGHGAIVPGGAPRTTIVEYHPPQKLQSLMDLDLPEHGAGKDALLAMTKQILQYSVNTWDQGFMDKLYHSNNAVSLATELLLATLNTNVHVYTVSPALTLIEKATTRHLASLFSLNSSHPPNPTFPSPPSTGTKPPSLGPGGIAQPGGSASNLLALLTARNTLFPSTKTDGIASLNGKTLLIFASAHAHYSISKAASLLGLGSTSVIPVPVDSSGSMTGASLSSTISTTKSTHPSSIPFFVCATSGTTVLGSYDDIESIAEVCRKEGLWLHVDASWGGGVMFSDNEKYRSKMRGVEKAESVAVTPHKMLGTGLTCSFLLVREVGWLRAGNGMEGEGGYLFHHPGGEEEVGMEGGEGAAAAGRATGGATTGGGGLGQGREVWDLADLTPQCGRKGDALKMFLGWVYYGRKGYAAMVDRAFEMAGCLAELVDGERDLVLVSEMPPPCLQVCFYYAKGGRVGDGGDGRRMTRVTEGVARGLVRRGFMIDYAPGDKGHFLRAVVNCETRRGTLEGLVKAVVEEGEGVWKSVVAT